MVQNVAPAKMINEVVFQQVLYLNGSFGLCDQSERQSHAHK